MKPTLPQAMHSEPALPSRRPHGTVMRVLGWIGSRELVVLIMLFAFLLVLWAFVAIADGVSENELSSFDHAVMLAMRNAQDLSDPLGPSWMEEIGRDVTALGAIVVLGMATLAAIGFLLLEGKRRVALLLLIATLGALGLSMLLKHSFDRPRPDLVPHAAMVYTASFPSAHSMLAASTYLTLGALLARVQRRRTIKAYILSCAVLLTLLVGISRVYLGVHWPSDVLAGWAAGAGWALLCWLLARWLQLHGKLEKEDEPQEQTE